MFLFFVHYRYKHVIPWLSLIFLTCTRERISAEPSYWSLLSWVKIMKLTIWIFKVLLCLCLL